LKRRSEEGSYSDVGKVSMFKEETVYEDYQPTRLTIIGGLWGEKTPATVEDGSRTKTCIWGEKKETKVKHQDTLQTTGGWASVSLEVIEAWKARIGWYF